MKTVTRLFKSFQPEHYALNVQIDADHMQFCGTVTVRGKKTGRPSQRLTFHQHGVKVESATIVRHDKKGESEISLSRINHQESLDEVRLHSDSMLYPGQYEVTMYFSGSITRGMTGLYPCYFKVDGTEHCMFATQFESHHAREVFPCIDEPEAKATFDLTLRTPTGQTVLANTPVKQTATEADEQVTSFESTPRMSTYLLAFVIGELQNKSTRTKRGTEVNVWATIAQPADSLDFALDVAKRSIEYFEDYFGVEYPLAKADHVALPDFSSGAMENWGLITYRERILLAYPGASQSIKESIATVIAHETSHQWFGNLVTMRWWDDLWLNESFANMMEYQAVDDLFPEWHIWDQFVVSEGLASLRRDAIPGVQSVKSAVRHPDEINTLFDPAIVYAKGGRLLNMMKHYIGDEAFQKGLSAYFVKHAYGNTTGNDLWQALSEASGQDVAAFMNPWLERPGFPVISVDQTDKEVLFIQTHFLEGGQVSDGRLWPVPLFSNQPELPAAFTKSSLHRHLKSDGYILVNQGFAGHYLVNYKQPGHRAYVVGLVEQMVLDIPNRVMLLNGASMLSKAGYQAFGDVLELLAAYHDELSEPVWGIIALIVAEARRFIDYDESLEDRIRYFIRGLIEPEYEQLGWTEKPDESTSDRKLRATILGLGSYAEEPAVVVEALRRFEQYKHDPEDTPQELRSIIFTVPVKQKTAGAFEYLIQLHDETVNSELKADAMSALCTTRDEDEAKRLLERLKKPDLVKPQDADYWLVYLLRNRHTRAIAWDWMVANWTWIVETYAHDKSYDNFPRYAASACNTPEYAKRYAEFFEPKQDQIALQRNIHIALAEINTRVTWLQRDLKSVEDFFGA